MRGRLGCLQMLAIHPFFTVASVIEQFNFSEALVAISRCQDPSLGWVEISVSH